MNHNCCFLPSPPLQCTLAVINGDWFGSSSCICWGKICTAMEIIKMKALYELGKGGAGGGGFTNNHWVLKMKLLLILSNNIVVAQGAAFSAPRHVDNECVYKYFSPAFHWGCTTQLGLWLQSANRSKTVGLSHFKMQLLLDWRDAKHTHKFPLEGMISLDTISVPPWPCCTTSMFYIWETKVFEVQLICKIVLVSTVQ